MAPVNSECLALQLVRHQLRRLAPQTPYDRGTEFVGNRVRDLAHSTLSSSRFGDYWATEKKDGVRQILIHIRLQSKNEAVEVWMSVGRDERYEMIGDYPHLEQVEWNHCYLLDVFDGEICPQAAGHTPVFWVFDCLVSDGRDIIGQSFAKRHQLLTSRICQVKRAADIGKGLDLQLKPCEPVRKLNEASLHAMTHATEGIVFYSDRAKYHDHKFSVLRWKHPHLLTADLQIRWQGDDPRDTGYVSNCKADLLSIDVGDTSVVVGSWSPQSQGELDLLGKSEIGEFRVDSDGFTFKRGRPDRVTPNFIHGVRAIQKQAQDPITADQLRTAIVGCRRNNGKSYSSW
ncbi:unnamed protein product [Jaminaea pallidilutea]